MTRGRIVEQTAQASAAPPPIDGERVAAAWKSIRADPSIQFDLPEKIASPREPPPAWLDALLRGIGRFVEWVGGGWRVLLYAALAAIVIALIVALVPGVRDWFAGWFGRKESVEQPGWVPSEGTARALLEDADALAAAGRYGEAVHLLLFRSIDDIVAWRGDVVQVADTSRDIARADALPPHARGVFAGIVAAVERSLFGGAELGEADWRRAREDYAGFALGRRA